MKIEELYEAVLKAKLDGKKDEIIKSEALESGWSEEEISQALKDSRPRFSDLVKILLISTFATLIPLIFQYILEIYNEKMIIKITNLNYFPIISIFLTFILIFIFNFLYSLKNKDVFKKISRKDMINLSIFFVLFATLIQLIGLLIEPSTPYESLTLSETHAAGQVLFIIFFPFAVIGNIYLAILLFINILIIKRIINMF